MTCVKCRTVIRPIRSNPDAQPRLAFICGGRMWPVVGSLSQPVPSSIFIILERKSKCSFMMSNLCITYHHLLMPKNILENKVICLRCLLCVCSAYRAPPAQLHQQRPHLAPCLLIKYSYKDLILQSCLLYILYLSFTLQELGKLKFRALSTSCQPTHTQK